MLWHIDARPWLCIQKLFARDSRCRLLSISLASKGHTHEAYEPPVDTCGGDDCPAELPLDNSATLMSYCKFCDGENRALMKSPSFPCNKLETAV